MDRAEAIKYLEDCRSQAIHDGVITIGRWRTDVFDMAIAALREQEQREQKATTNADRIRAMTDEELANFIYAATRACNNYECENCPIGDENCPELDKWLQQPCADHFRDTTKMMGGAE